MRLVRISAPAGKGGDIAKIAFACGIHSVSIHRAEEHQAAAPPAAKEVIDVHIATPQSKALVEAVLAAPFFNRDEYSIDVREPRAILETVAAREITRPVAAPLLDIGQELWQFAHITWSFVARVFIAALLVAYGMIQDNPLMLAGGLIFLPFMPLLLGVSFGGLHRQWTLVAQSLAAAVTASLLIVAGAAAVAAVVDDPMMFEHFPPMAAGVVFSFAIAIAAALATADDAGHRQLIGLAAASQLALVPAWLGVSLVHGFSEDPAEKLLSFGLNALALIAGAALIYFILARGHGRAVHPRH